MIANGIEIKLIVEPSELDSLLTTLEEYIKRKALVLQLPKNKSANAPSERKHIFDGPPLKPEELLAIVERAEKAEKTDREGFKKALGI